LGYFQELGFTLPEHKNPADFVLDLSNKLPLTEDDVDVRQAYLESDMYRQTREEIDAGIFPEDAKVHRHKHRYATNIFISGWEICKRNLTSYWRMFQVVKLNAISFFALGLLLGFFYFRLDDNQQGAHSRAGLLYFALLVTNLIVIPILPVMILQRAVYYRERASLTYRSITYLFGLLVVNLPFLVLYALIFSIPLYWLVGFRAEPDVFFIFLLVLLLTLLLNQSYIAFLAAISPNLIVAMTIMALSLSLFSLFSGFLIPRGSIPNYWIWANYLDLSTYGLEALIINEFKGLALHCSGNEFVDVVANNKTIEICPITSGEQFLSTFDYQDKNLWRNVGIMAGLYIFFVIVTGMALKLIKHIKR